MLIGRRVPMSMARLRVILFSLVIVSLVLINNIVLVNGWVSRARSPQLKAAREEAHSILRARYQRHVAIHLAARYQSPQSGNDEFNNSAVPTTVAEIDDNVYEWTPDRPHDESFFLPSTCPTGERECCLSYMGEVCGGDVRGTCKNILADDSVCRITEGLFWFSDYFDYACVCNGNYWGTACEQCKTGWQGDTCSEPADLLVRRDFAQLSDVDKQYVIDAFRLAKLTPSDFQPNVSVYDYWATVHHWSLPGGVIADLELYPWLVDIAEGHVGSGAIPYHRALVAGFERALQGVLGNSSFALPYWNWTYSLPNDNNVVFKWFGGDGDTDVMGDGVESFCRQPPPDSLWMGECDCVMNRGPFALWPLVGDWGYPLNDTIERAFGCHTLWAPSLPFQPAVDCAICVTQFDMPEGNFNSADPLGLDGLAPQPPTDLPPTPPEEFIAPDMPTAAEKAFALKRSQAQREVMRTSVSSMSYEDGAVFHNLLGGGFLCDGYSSWPDAEKSTDLHERTHRWLSGTLLGHHPASDPLFWMLHGYADTIFEQWLRNADYYGLLSADNSWSATVGPLGHTRYECQGPMFPLEQQFASFNDSRYLGFTYDFFLDDETCPTCVPKYHDEPWLLDYPDLSALTFTYDTVNEDADIPQDTAFFFPESCSGGTSCCPTYNDEICGGMTRGACVDITASDAVCDLTNHASGLFWFSNNYQYACVCNDNYYGANCGECQAGYEGDDCSTKSSIRTRRDFDELSIESRQYIIDAFRAARTAESQYQPGVTVLEFFATMVYWRLPYNSQANIDSTPDVVFDHQGNVLWQRQVLLRFERELARITGNSSFVLPYWNWATSMANDNDAVLRWFGGDGQTNSSADTDQMHCRIADRAGEGGCNCTISRDPFSELPLVGAFGSTIGTVQRSFSCLGSVAASLPDQSIVDYVTTIPLFYSTDDQYESFAKTMTGTMFEGGLHTWPPGKYGDMMARVQNWMGGTSTTPELRASRFTDSSPGSDPMWWMALGYSDLTVERWMRRALYYGWDTIETLPIINSATGLGRNECLAPLYPLITHAQAFETSIELGYSFDFFDVHPDDANESKMT